MLPPRRVGLLFFIAIQGGCILTKGDDVRHSHSRRTHHNASDAPNYAAAKYLIFFAFGRGARDVSNEHARMRAGTGQQGNLNPEVLNCPIWAIHLSASGNCHDTCEHSSRELRLLGDLRVEQAAKTDPA
jgi:hypothetical protein